MTVLAQTSSLAKAAIAATKFRQDYGDRIKVIQRNNKYQIIFLGTKEEFEKLDLEVIWCI